MWSQGVWVGKKKSRDCQPGVLCQAGHHCGQVPLGTPRWGKRGAFIQWLLWSSLTKGGPKGEKRLQLWQGAIWLSCATPVTQLWLRCGCPGGQEAQRVQWVQQNHFSILEVWSTLTRSSHAVGFYTDSLKNRLKKNHACSINQSINQLNFLT